MTSRKNTISRVLAAVGVTAILAVGAVTPSSAATTGRGYTADHARAYHARARAPARSRRYFAHGARDNPPGSAFQSFGNAQSIGRVR